MDESQDPHSEHLADKLEWFSNNPRLAVAVLMARLLIDLTVGDIDMNDIKNGEIKAKVIYFEYDSREDAKSLFLVKDNRVHRFTSKMGSEMIIQSLKGNRVHVYTFQPRSIQEYTEKFKNNFIVAYSNAFSFFYMSKNRGFL